MYQIELSEAALNDLRDFDKVQALQILDYLQGLEIQPKPTGIQLIALPEAAEGRAYLHETAYYNLFYNIFEATRLVKVVAIFKKINLN